MHKESPGILLQRLQSRDAAALEALYHQLSASIYTVILRMTGDPTLSEDILQEFFVKLYRSPPTTLPRNPRAYLFRMAHNLTIDCLKKEPQTSSISDYDHLTGSSGTTLVERLDLERALAALCAADREIVTLHAGAGLKFREVAEVVAMPLGTVLWRYQRAIGKLRELLNGGTP